MYKTTQGGNKKHRVSYRYVKAIDNSRAGGAYGGLVSGSRLKSGRNKSFIVVPILDEYVPTFPINVRRK